MNRTKSWWWCAASQSATSAPKCISRCQQNRPTQSSSDCGNIVPLSARWLIHLLSSFWRSKIVSVLRHIVVSSYYIATWNFFTLDEVFRRLMTSGHSRRRRHHHHHRRRHRHDKEMGQDTKRHHRCIHPCSFRILLLPEGCPLCMCLLLCSNKVFYIWTSVLKVLSFIFMWARVSRF